MMRMTTNLVDIATEDFAKAKSSVDIFSAHHCDDNDDYDHAHDGDDNRDHGGDYDDVKNDNHDNKKMIILPKISTNRSENDYNNNDGDGD